MRNQPSVLNALGHWSGTAPLTVVSARLVADSTTNPRGLSPLETIHNDGTTDNSTYMRLLLPPQ